MHIWLFLGLLAAIAVLGSVAGGYRLTRRRPNLRTSVGEPLAAESFADVAGVAIAASVISSVPGAGGGDIVDVFKLDARFTLLLVADVSGKGIEAAAHTAFIKYTLRTLALECDGDPAVVVAKFNAMYPRTIVDTEAFVVLILGIIDSRTGDVRYASAGHEPAFVRRRNGNVALLAPTGPIVGAAPFSAYRSDVVTLGAGDVLVWTTDGLTESRDRRRRLLGADGLAAWIAGAPSDVRSIAQSLLAALRLRSGGVVQDDVAVLAVAYEPVIVPVARRTIPSYRYDSQLGVRNRRAD